MAKHNKEKSYWPHMIVGFLLIGITLGYWTVKSAVAVPVQESNTYMMKYQKADLNFNEIMANKALFDKEYTISIVDAPMAMQEIENAKRAKEEKSVVLKEGKNSFLYTITAKDHHPVTDANVTFLLTRPHTTKEDTYVENIPLKNGEYRVEDISIVKPGRYSLQLRATIGNKTGYLELPAYLKP